MVNRTLENALWGFYKEAASHRGEAWNPSQVDCGTWLANMQLLILTDEINDAFEDISGTGRPIKATLHAALQENQHALTPTRPPLCIAERRHNGGDMERADKIITSDLLYNLEEKFFLKQDLSDVDPVTVNTNTGLVQDICNGNIWDSAKLNVYQNGAEDPGIFAPGESYLLDDEDFLGMISDQNLLPKQQLAISSYNIKLGNGSPLGTSKYRDACAVTTIVEFTNLSKDEQKLNKNTGVTFTNLFKNYDATPYLTSDGDRVVDEKDTWVIFEQAYPGNKLLAVELLGHRQGDFRDVLHMTYDDAKDDLFLGLRADYELNEEEVDGERGFLSYTMHLWDSSTLTGYKAVKQDLVSCYEAADIWARQYFDLKDLNNIYVHDAAEFAVRSQCFSNSRSNQRFRTDDSGYWSLNTDYGMHGNVVVNPGWLAPNMDFEVYVKKYDESIFKGPRTIVRTDDTGQLMTALPTVVEDDRILLKSAHNCCDDYDLVIPCKPEFKGFAGAPGVPYVPSTTNPTVSAK